MSDYKNELYKTYGTTHTAHRKRAGSKTDFSNRVFTYEREMGKFLPADQSAKMLDIDLELGVINIVCGDLFSVSEHFTKPNIVRILKLCQGALTPTGKLTVHAPNGESPFFSRVPYDCEPKLISHVA